MRSHTPLLAAAAAALGLAAPAPAAVPHTVAPGETLWSIAAANNYPTERLAAFNGLSPDAQVVLGSTIQIPSEAELLAGGAGVGASGASGAGAPPPAGAYTVQPGDTFSSLAARAGVRADQVAGVNGLSLDAPLLAGTVIKLPPASTLTGQVSSPAPAGTPTPQAPSAGPVASPGRVDAGTVQGTASAHGVSPSLAAAIAWQESGFNNGVVSSANARGVMQILPGTWNWIQQNLAAGQLSAHSAQDNVHAGVLYLDSLLKATGGDEAMAAAAYYQGLSSVRKIGMLPETQRYVANVQALRARFGG